MVRRIQRMRLEQGLLIATVLLVLLTAAVWVHDHWGRPSGTAITLTIAPGRELYLNVWKPGPAHDPGDRDRHDRLIPGTGPMQVAIWYQDTIAVVNRRLAIFEMPIWPLLVSSLGAIVVLGATWRYRARR